MRRTIVLLTAMAAMVVVYAGAALAASVDEVEPNDSIGHQFPDFTDNSQNIDASFSLDADPNIADSTTVPHATILGTGNGTRDYYSFTVPEAGIGTFDIDGACCISAGGFDSYLRLYAINNGTPLADNDDSPNDPGSPPLCDGCLINGDSYITYNFSSAGTYYIEVGSCCPSPAAGPVPNAVSYKLHVSIPNHPVQEVIDNIAPTVTSTVPQNGTRNVLKTANLTATFSERMDPDTLSTSTFKLFKVNADGTTKRITDAPVKLSVAALTAKLNPFGSSDTRLAKNTRYKAVVTTGATYLAGNALDQDDATSGNQQKVWYFTTGAR